MAASLFALLVYAGSLSFLKLIPKFRLQTALWEVTTCLNQARFKAIWQGKAYRVSFAASGYALDWYDEEHKAWKADRSALLTGVEIQANNAPVFHPGGTVSDLATITVKNSRGSYKITIAISGRIKTTKLG